MAKNTSNWIKTKHNFTSVWRTKLTNSSLTLIPHAKKKKCKIHKRMSQKSSLSDDEWIDITDSIETNESEELLHNSSKESIEIPRDIHSLSSYEQSHNEMIYNKSADIKFSTMLNTSNDHSFLPPLSLSPIDSIFKDNLQTEPVSSSVYPNSDYHKDKHIIEYVGSLNCTDISIKQVKSEGALNIMDRHNVNFIPLINKQQNLTSTPLKTNFGNISLDLSAISDNSCPEINTNISGLELFVEDNENDIQNNDKAEETQLQNSHNQSLEQKENDMQNSYKGEETQLQNSHKQSLEQKENNIQNSYKGEETQLQNLHNQSFEQRESKILTKTDHHPYPVCSIVATLLNQQENKLSSAKKSNRDTSKPLSQYPVCSLVSLLQKK